MTQRARIVEAMIELKERRASGATIHEILAEVADYHNVPMAELRRKAEASWGVPLETDRERHAEHFDLVRNAADIAKQARELATATYERALLRIKKFPGLSVNWDSELERFLEDAKLDDPVLESSARTAFSEEATRLKKAVRMAKVSYARNR